MIFVLIRIYQNIKNMPISTSGLFWPEQDVALAPNTAQHAFVVQNDGHVSCTSFHDSAVSQYSNFLQEKWISPLFFPWKN